MKKIILLMSLSVLSACGGSGGGGGSSSPGATPSAADPVFKVRNLVTLSPTQLSSIDGLKFVSNENAIIFETPAIYK
ncbi:hypothetical protein [Vibrio sp. HN007]|uniref:hypothetical protein n=1 Tax=Vibrio iocasae TaxID=3098914 RepID=UPI0035D4D85A